MPRWNRPAHFGEHRAQLFSPFQGILTLCDSLGVQSAQPDALGHLGGQGVARALGNGAALFLGEGGGICSMKGSASAPSSATMNARGI